MGGSQVLSYNLQWDEASNGVSWKNVIGFQPSSLALTTILTNGVSGGLTYKFRVRARNVHGWGAFSTETSIKAAQIPDQMSSVTTSIDVPTGGVLISWTMPHDGYQSIINYLVEIQTSTGAWKQDVSNCKGSDPAMLTCLIPMSVLIATPYNLNFDTLIVVRATAQNSYGFAKYPSVANTDGARIRITPSQMAAPTIVLHTDTTIQVRWVELTGVQTGNSPILSYNLYWDNASGSIVYELVDSLVTTFTVTGLTGGQNYSFKVRARNVYGYGQQFSSELIVQASDLPGQPNIVSVGLDSTNVVISWVPPQSHFSPIDSYNIKILDAQGNYFETSFCDGTN